jgi:hypothetical protein
MALTANEILDRTTLLINNDFFHGELRVDDIVNGLMSTTIRIVGDEQSLSNVAGQTALVTMCTLAARMGVALEVDIPTMPVVGPQPPIRPGPSILDSIDEYVGRLVPGAKFNAGTTVHATYNLGTTKAIDRGAQVVAWNANEGFMGPAAAVSGRADGSDWPLGALAAAGVAASDMLRLAVTRIATSQQRRAPINLRPPSVDIAHIIIGPRPVHGLDLGDVDIISAGAITHGALYALLRVPNLRAKFRVLDEDVTQASNVNRYQLLSTDELDLAKVRQLEGFSTSAIAITGVDRRYEPGQALAQTVLIGADHIPTRWAAQAQQPNWLGIGATSHLFTEISTHAPSTACAGCIHTHDEVGDQPIPTVSVVSFWAGLLLAAETIDLVVRADGQSRHTMSYPLGIGGRSGLIQTAGHPSRRCAIGCQASSSLPSSSAA